MADFMQTGSYERHVRRLRRKNADRRTALLEALADRFGDTIEVQGSDAGLHLVVWFNALDVTREGDLAENAKMRGLGVYPISGLYAEKPTALRSRAGFVFGYAALEEGEIRRGIARLAHTVRSL